MKPKVNLFSKIRTSGMIAAAAVVMLVLSACNPAPKYAKPPAQAPSAFKEAPPQDYKEGQGWKLAQPGDASIRGNWWEIYNDPTLNALEIQVGTQNQTILQAEATYRQARSLVVSARSQLYPTIGASPAYSNAKISQTTRTTVVGSGTTTGTGTTTTTSSASTGVLNNFSLPFDISYEVDFWHRIRNQIAENTFAAQASAADVATALLSTQAEVARDYFEIRALDAQRKILEQTVENYQQTLQLTTSLYHVGIDSEEEVAQAQTQVDTTRAQATDLGVSRATFEHAIAVLIGKPPAGFSLPIEPFHPTPPEVPVALPSELLERRPDIAAAERRIAAANSAIGIARAAYYPNLSLSADGGFQTSHFTQWFNWPSHFWSLGPTLSQTLFDGGARRAANEQAEAAYDSDVASYRATVLSAFQSVEDQLATLTILSKEVVQEQTAVNSANHYLDLSLTRFKAGVDSYLNVITAQTALLTNRETELQIQLRQMTASVSLVMAMGGGWNPNSLPQYKDLLARPPEWHPASDTPQPPAGAITPANPPPLPADLPVPVAPAASPQPQGAQ